MSAPAAEARVVEFAIPDVPPSVNVWSRLHWRVRAKAAKDWRQRVNAYARIGALHSLRLLHPFIYDVPVVVTMSFRLPRGGDADNRCKLVLDGLVGVYLKDDGPPWLAELRVRSERGKPAETRIRIEPHTPKEAA